MAAPGLASTAPAGSARLLFVLGERSPLRSRSLTLAHHAARCGLRVAVAAPCPEPRLEQPGRSPVRWQPSSGGGWGKLGMVVRLLGIYRRRRPDIVHHVSLGPVISGSLVAALTSVPSTINAVTGIAPLLAPRGGRDRVAALALRVVLRWALGRPGSVAIVQELDDLAALERLGVEPERIRLITAPRGAAGAALREPGQSPALAVVSVSERRVNRRMVALYLELHARHRLGLLR